MEKGETLRVTGKVAEVFPGTKYSVTLENDVKVMCTISGKLRIHNIRVLPGDMVDIELSPYDLTKGRIIWRHR